MAIRYEEITNEFGQKQVKRFDEDGTIWFIPTDPANSDYQAYLATLAANSAPTA